MLTSFPSIDMQIGTMDLDDTQMTLSRKIQSAWRDVMKIISLMRIRSKLKCKLMESRINLKMSSNLKVRCQPIRWNK